MGLSDALPFICFCTPGRDVVLNHIDEATRRYLIGIIKRKLPRNSFSVDYQDARVTLEPMAIQEPTEAPAPFIKLLRKSIASSGLSLRDIGRQVDVSTAYMSRLVNKQRGLPADDILVKLEHVLDIQPRGALFYAAGRLDAATSKVMEKEPAQILMRTLAKLTEEELAAVQKVAQQFANKRERNAK